MFRLILIIAAVLIIGQLLRIGLRQLRNPGPREDATPPEDFELMTQCPHCGVHLPKATLDNGSPCPQCHQ
jgi:hypothetical protein